MSKTLPLADPLDHHVRLMVEQVSAATNAAREALRAFEPQVRELAIRQLSVDAEISAAAVRQFEARQTSFTSPTAVTQPIAAPTMWTPDQLAEHLHVSRSAVDKWIGSGALRKTKAGKRVLITDEDLRDYLRNSTLSGRKVA